MPLKITTDKFIENSQKIHGDKYDYSQTNYIKSSLKLIIICREHGDFHQTANNHISGHGCPKCSNIKISKNLSKTMDFFINEACEKHNNEYSYDKVEYVNSNTKITITCRIHGDFEQKPANHLNGQGCAKCANLTKNQNKKLTTESFIEKSRIIHGEIYNYSKVRYLKSNIKVDLICKEHGTFKIKPNSHLAGQGCSKCGIEKSGKSRRLTQEDFIDKANKTHNNSYTYEKTKYIKSNMKVTITCPIHGDFIQVAGGHLDGRGCLECFIDKGNFTKDSFKNKAKGRVCTLYIIRCYNETENFFKVGITSRKVEDRFKTDFYMPYFYEIIYQYKSNSEKIYDLEKLAHRESKKYKYKPLIKFGGYTECYTKELNIKNITDNEWF